MPKRNEPTLEDVLKRSADGTAPAVSVSIVDAAHEFADGIDLELIQQLIRSGALDRLDLHLPWKAFEKALRLKVNPLLVRGIVQGADVASSMTARAIHSALGTEPTLTFDGTNPRVDFYVRTRTARLVTNVTDETKAAIRDTIARAMREEMPPIQLHREIKQVIGLNRRQALAVANYRRGLAGQNVPRQTMTERVARFTDDQLKYRAQMIARTEMMDAINAGHIEGQRQARDSGLFGSKQGWKTWVTAPEDGRLCPTCRAMNGVRVPLDSKFTVTVYVETKSGLSVKGRMQVDHAPVHPHCRCTHILTLE